VDNLVERAVEDSLWLTERISKLEAAPSEDSDKGSQDFLEQQHRTWIAEPIYASVNDDVCERLANHEELHRNDGAVMWAIFMTEYGNTPQDALVEAEMMLRVEKLHLSEHSNYITQLTTYMQTQVRRILNSGNGVTPHHFINLFDQLIVVKHPEFANIIVTLYKEWCTRSGEGHNLGIMRLLNKIDLDVLRINKGGLDLVSGEDSTVLAMKAEMADLKQQLHANVARTDAINQQNVALIVARNDNRNRESSRDSNRNKGRNNGGYKRKFPNWPKKEEKQTCTINGETYKYCGECPNNRHWNKTHLTEGHAQGFTGDTATQKHANMTWAQTKASSEVFSDF
jgi:hypothetical protein